LIGKVQPLIARDGYALTQSVIDGPELWRINGGIVPLRVPPKLLRLQQFLIDLTAYLLRQHIEVVHAKVVLVSSSWPSTPFPVRCRCANATSQNHQMQQSSK
jgi:hypothetical protein